MATVSVRRLRGPRREAHARAALTRLARSGLPRAAFARVEGVSPVTLSRWVAEFGAPAASTQPPSGGGGFVEVKLDRALSAGFELDLGGGRCLRIPSDFDGNALRRLLRALSTTRSC